MTKAAYVFFIVFMLMASIAVAEDYDFDDVEVLGWGRDVKILITVGHCRMIFRGGLK